MRRFVLLALLAVPAALASQGAADEPGIYGYVLAPDGVPVSGGTVLSLSSADPASASTPIDRIGRFRIPCYRAGFYRVTVSVPGFAPYQFLASVPASRTLRLPVIHLEPASYFRVRFVSPAGEPITSPVIRRRSSDGSGAPILDAPDAGSIEIDADDATRIGPLPHGITALALDTPNFAQTRVPNVSVTGAKALLDGGTIVVQSGSTLHVDLFDASGMPVPDHVVLLEDLLPLSPLQFPFPVQTNAQGRVTFDRLAAGPYRVRTGAAQRCLTQDLSLARTVRVSGTDIVTARIVVAGTATFRLTSPVGRVKGVVVSARPDNPEPPSPMRLFGRVMPSLVALSLSTTRCRGTTDADGRVTLTSFPPGPSDIAVHFANSLYVRRVNVPIGGAEVVVPVPDGFLPVRVVNAVNHEPVQRAFVTWTVEGGGRSEATATIIGEALLEGVGTRAGLLSVTAPGFQPAEERLPEPPGILHDVTLVPLPDANLRVRVVTASGDALPNAVVEVAAASPLWAPQVAVTDAKGVVTFPDVPAGTLRVTAIANGYVASTIRVSQDNRIGAVLTLSSGYRAVVGVELPATVGALLVRVLDTAGRTLDALLDGASDRGIEPPGRLSLGPLPPGDYVIELRGAREPRQERIRIVDRDVVATFR
jgi:carboxypeptidase family protein